MKPHNGQHEPRYTDEPTVTMSLSANASLRASPERPVSDSGTAPAIVECRMWDWPEGVVVYTTCKREHAGR